MVRKGQKFRKATPNLTMRGGKVKTAGSTPHTTKQGYHGTARKGRTIKDKPPGSIVNRAPGKGKAAYIVYDRQQPGYWTRGSKHAFCGAENRNGDTECLRPKGHDGRHRYSGIL